MLNRFFKFILMLLLQSAVCSSIVMLIYRWYIDSVISINAYIILLSMIAIEVVLLYKLGFESFKITRRLINGFRLRYLRG